MALCEKSGKDPGQAPGQFQEELTRLRGELQAAMASQAALAKAAERYQSLFALAADAVLVGDPAGNFIDVNDSAVNLTGYSREGLLGMNIAGLFSPEERERKPLRYDLLQQGQVVLTERELLRKDGTMVAVSMHSKMMPDGTYHAFIRDITERKTAENVLKQSEAMLSSILRAAPIGIGTTRRRVLTWLSEPLLAMLGYAHDELVGQSARVLYEDEAEFVRVGEVKYRQIEERKVGVVETRWRCKDGRFIDVLLSSTLLDATDPDGGVTFTAMDITERKRIEAHEREVAALKREFIATASHELRTPLAICRGYLEMLMEHKGFSSAQRREFLEIAYDKTMVLSKLIDELLDIDKIEGGNTISLERRPVNIARLVTEIVDNLPRDGNLHLLVTEFDDPSMKVPLDRDKFVQVVENLINNAVKFSPRGGKILVRGEVAEGCYRLSVTDSGIGISDEYAEKIFDKFFRVDTANTAVSGLGIGLYLVRSIVAAHGGTVTVRSRPGEGATFIVNFPLPE
jgi:PAS domain S-box-containing protein